MLNDQQGSTLSKQEKMKGKRKQYAGTEKGQQNDR